MKRICILLATCLLLSGMAGAQAPGTLQQVVKVSQNFRSQVDSGSSEVQWTGLGLVSGDMVDMRLENTSSTPQSYEFVPGMVLEDPGESVQPILLEEKLSFTLEPGEVVKRRMRGYCLDYSKEPPASGDQEDYQVATELDEYESAVDVVYRGLDLEERQKLKPVLRPIVHRTVVIQRAIWAVLGGENPVSQEELKKDLEDEIRYRSSIFPEGQLDCLSRRIWSDVQQVMNSGE